MFYLVYTANDLVNWVKGMSLGIPNNNVETKNIASIFNTT